MFFILQDYFLDFAYITRSISIINPYIYNRLGPILEVVPSKGPILEVVPSKKNLEVEFFFLIKGSRYIDFMYVASLKKKLYVAQIPSKHIHIKTDLFYFLKLR